VREIHEKQVDYSVFCEKWILAENTYSVIFIIFITQMEAT